MVRARAPALLRCCAAICLATTAACGGAQGSAETAAGANPAAGPGAEWATQFLGMRPERTAVVRFPPNALHDSLWTSTFDLRSWKSHSSDHWVPVTFADVNVIAECAQADFFFTTASVNGSDGTGIVVLHGVRSGDDPRTFGFVYQGTSQSGTKAYRASNDEKDKSVELFVLPSSPTWVLANGVAGARLSTAFMSNTNEPPLLPALPGSFVDATGPIEDVGTPVSRARELGWIKNFAHVKSAGVVLYPPTPAGIAIAGKLVYSDSGDANDAAADLRRLIADPSSHTLMTKGDVSISVETVGSTLVFKEVLATHENANEAKRPEPPSRKVPSPEAVMVSINGKGNVSLEALRGKVVVLTIGRTSDTESKRIFPKLQRLRDQYSGAGLEVIGVAVENDPNAVLRFAKELGVSFPLVLDPDRVIYQRWAPDITPTTYVIDRSGAIRATILYVHQDKDLDDRSVETEARALL